MGSLNLPENIAEVLDRQVAKTGKLSIFRLLSFFVSSVSETVSQASTIMAKSYYNNSIAKNIINHRVLHSPPIGRKELRLVG